MIQSALLIYFIVPLLAAAILAFRALSRKKPNEARIALLIQTAFGCMLVASLIALIAWLALEQQAFRWKGLYVDFDSIVFLGVIAVFLNVIVHYSRRYMHRDPGYRRFFMILSFFACGMALIATSGDFVWLFAGWEIVGLSSWLLIGFYWHRPQAVVNANRAYFIYRFCDVGFLASAMIAGLIWHDHQMFHSHWSQVPLWEQWVLSSLILLPVLGKSAQFPFSYWLPRAMEGPTPSSAIFYGALSVHAGVFLLLRTYPIWHSTPGFSWLVGGIGLLTAVLTSLCSRVQSNIKGQIGYASITQVGFMLTELALGLPKLAFFHLVANAFLRCFQLLISPSVQVEQLDTHHALEGRAWHSWNPRSRTLYVLAINEGYLETMIQKLLSPFDWLSRALQKSPVWLSVAVVPIFWRYPTAFMLAGLFFALRALNTEASPQSILHQAALSNLCVALALGPYSARLYVVGLLFSWILASDGLYHVLKQPFATFARFPLASAVVLIGVLGVLGFPISATFWGEDILMEHAYQQGFLFLLGLNLIFVMNGVSLIRLYTRIFWGKRDENASQQFDWSTSQALWRLGAYTGVNGLTLFLATDTPIPGFL